MPLLYDEVPRSGNGFFRKPNATKKYLEHYNNRLYLSFVLRNGSFEEKQQAHKELDICDRKIEYWQRQDSFEREKANEGIIKIQRVWRKAND